MLAAVVHEAAGPHIFGPDEDHCVLLVPGKLVLVSSRLVQRAPMSRMIDNLDLKEHQHSPLRPNCTGSKFEVKEEAGIGLEAATEHKMIWHYTKTGLKVAVVVCR